VIDSTRPRLFGIELAIEPGMKKQMLDEPTTPALSASTKLLAACGVVMLALLFVGMYVRVEGKPMLLRGLGIIFGTQDTPIPGARESVLLSLQDFVASVSDDFHRISELRDTKVLYTSMEAEDRARTILDRIQKTLPKVAAYLPGPDSNRFQEILSSLRGMEERFTRLVAELEMHSRKLTSDLRPRE
jgi:hypothetical protein